MLWAQEEESGGVGPTAGGAFGEDDGYVSPEFDIPDASDEEADARPTFDMPPPAKKRKGTDGRKDKDKVATSGFDDAEDLEALALQKLRRR